MKKHHWNYSNFYRKKNIFGQPIHNIN